MHIEEAKRELQAAEDNLRKSEAHLDRTMKDCRMAEAAYWDHSRHRSMRRTYGDGYRQRFRNAKDAAKRDFDHALACRDRAVEAVRKAEREGCTEQSCR